MALERTTDEKKRESINPNIAIIAGAVLVSSLIARPVLFGLLEALGLRDSKSDTSFKKLQATVAEYFSPTYLTNLSAKGPTSLEVGPGSSYLFSQSTTDQLAKAIYDAKGFFNDNENAVYGVFSQINTKAQVSWLATRFAVKYKYDLLEYLKSFLNQKELEPIYTSVNSYY